MTETLLPSEIAKLILAQCSQELRSAMATREALGSSFSIRPSAIRPLLDAVKAIRPLLDAHTAPASIETVRKWVTVVVDQTVHRMTVPEIDRRVTMSAKVVSSHPSCAFTEATLVRVLKTTKFTPVPAELNEIIWSLVQPLIDVQKSIAVIESLCLAASVGVTFDPERKPEGAIVKFVDQSDRANGLAAMMGTEY
jgi:hypothetical protein